MNTKAVHNALKLMNGHLSALEEACASVVQHPASWEPRTRGSDKKKKKSAVGWF